MATILITGAARRIGKAMALDLAAHGHAVVVHHHNSFDEATALVDKIQKMGVSCACVSADLNDRAETAALLAEAQALMERPIDVLINNASIYEHDTFETVTDDTWDRHMEINLHAPFTLSQKFVEALPADVRGSIINIIDQRVLKLNPQFMSYALAKSALWTLTRTMAQAVAPRIRVNAIGPGPTLPSKHQNDKKFTTESSEVLLQKGPALEEFSATVKYLLETPSITGQMITLDGGQHLAWLTPDIDPKDGH